MAFDKIRQLMSDVQNALNPASKKEAINKASGYVDSVDSDLKALAAQNDINIFASGENFISAIICTQKPFNLGNISPTVFFSRLLSL